MHEEIVRQLIRTTSNGLLLDHQGDIMLAQPSQHTPFIYFHLAENNDGVVTAMLVENPSYPKRDGVESAGDGRGTGETVAPLSKAWADSCCLAMSTLPWPEELLEHEVMNPEGGGQNLQY